MSQSQTSRGQKPKVAIIYSNGSSDESNESLYLAKYLGADMACQGYSTIFLVGYRSDHKATVIPSSARISFVHPKTLRVVEAPSADISGADWSAVPKCHVVIVTVRAKDTPAVTTLLTDALQASTKVAVISLQRGLKCGSGLISGFTNKQRCVAMEGVVGFAVVPDPATKALRSTIRSPAVALTRISKENLDVLEGPVSLLDESDLAVVYTRTLTCYSWGVVLYECLYALNAVTGGTMRATLGSWRRRVVYATMIREGLQGLRKAAGRGGWRPSLQLICGLAPKALELLLVLPDPLFWLVARVCGLSIEELPSPLLQDLTEGRDTNLLWGLEELVSMGKRYGVRQPVCELVLAHLRAVECAQAGGYTNSLHMLATVESLVFTGRAASSVTELRWWVLRLLACASLFYSLYWMLHIFA